MAGLSRQGTGFGWAAGVLARTVAGLLADAGLLAACFGLAGLPVPWRGLLFAYAAGQLAGRLVPLPGGLGGVEGGVLGALTLTGTRPAAAAAAVIIYRVAGYWAVGAAGTAAAAILGRRRSRGTGGEAPQQPAGCVDQGQDGVPALAALTEPARTARAAGQGPRPWGPASSPSAGRAGPGWARSGTRRTDAARSREPKPPATACPASRGCPKPGDTDGTDRSVVREDNDTGYDYHDTPSGNIWRPGAEPGQPPGDKPGRRPGSDRPGGASLPFPDRPHVASPPRVRTRTP